MDTSASTIGLALGVGLCAWVVFQLGLSLLRVWLRVARRDRRLRSRRAALRLRIDEAARRSPARFRRAAWEGVRPFRVAEKVAEAADIQSFYLVPADGTPLPLFAPGQFVTVEVPPAGGSQPLVRCYSLSDRPREDYYRLTIRKIDTPAGASCLLHDRVASGDTLMLHAPRGSFFLPPWGDTPVALIAGGIGITPLMSMLESMIYGRTQRTIRFLLAVRNSLHHPFKERLEQIDREHANVEMRISYSSPLAGDGQGRDFHTRGRLSMDQVAAFAPDPKADHYVCGPAGMMEWLVAGLRQSGVPDERIHFEAFGPASVKPARPVPANVAADGSQVRFARGGGEFPWDARYQSLLEFGEAHGVVLDYGCRAGNCGECSVAIRSGQVQTVKQPGAVVEEGHCLTCVSVPAGPLVLDG